MDRWIKRGAAHQTHQIKRFNQTRQCWWTINQESVMTLRTFLVHIVFRNYCLAVTWESLWPGRHLFCFKPDEWKPSAANLTVPVEASMFCSVILFFLPFEQKVYITVPFSLFPLVVLHQCIYFILSLQQTQPSSVRKPSLRQWNTPLMSSSHVEHL